MPDRAALRGVRRRRSRRQRPSTELAAALDTIVDERGSPKQHAIAPPARRSCSRPTSGGAPAATTRRAASPSRSCSTRWSRPSSGSGRTRRRSRSSTSRSATRPWARARSWSRPAARSATRLVAGLGALARDSSPSFPPDEDEELHARRLVAQRCLYGVDKNPLAVDLAKLSLWLATLARDHEFTFLDHALKSGDSLVGLTQAQIAAANWDESKPGLPLFRQAREAIASTEAMKARAEIQTAPDDTMRAIQEARHRNLEATARRRSASWATR